MLIDSGSYRQSLVNRMVIFVEKCEIIFDRLLINGSFRGKYRELRYPLSRDLPRKNFNPMQIKSSDNLFGLAFSELQGVGVASNLLPKIVYLK